MIQLPIYKDGSVIIFCPMATAEMQRKFALTAAYAKKKMEDGAKDCGKFESAVDLGATKEYTAQVRFSGVIDPAQKEGYLVNAQIMRFSNDKKEVMAEYFFAPDQDVRTNAMQFYNDAFGYSEGEPAQLDFFASLSEAASKFRTVIEFVVGHDIPNYFDLAALSYDMAFGETKPLAFNFINSYGVDPNNQFAEIEYLMVTIIEGKYAVRRKKIDLRINDMLDEGYTFTSFEKFSAFLLDL